MEHAENPIRIPDLPRLDINIPIPDQMQREIITLHGELKIFHLVEKGVFGSQTPDFLNYLVRSEFGVRLQPHTSIVNESDYVVFLLQTKYGSIKTGDICSGNSDSEDNPFDIKSIDIDPEQRNLQIVRMRVRCSQCYTDGIVLARMPLVFAYLDQW